MFEEDVIEFRSLDLDGGRVPREASVAKAKLERLARIAKMKLGPIFFGKSRGLERGRHAHFLKNPGVVGKQRFPDVETRKPFLFQNENAAAIPSKVCGNGASAGTATDDDDVVGTRRV